MDNEDCLPCQPVGHDVSSWLQLNSARSLLLIPALVSAHLDHRSISPCAGHGYRSPHHRAGVHTECSKACVITTKVWSATCVCVTHLVSTSSDFWVISGPRPVFALHTWSPQALTAERQCPWALPQHNGSCCCLLASALARTCSSCCRCVCGPVLLLGSLPARTVPPALAAAAALLPFTPLRCPAPGSSRPLQPLIVQPFFAGSWLGVSLVSVRLLLQSRFGGTLLSGPPPGSHLHSRARHETGSCLDPCNIALGPLLQPRLDMSLLLGPAPGGCLYALKQEGKQSLS